MISWLSEACFLGRLFREQYVMGYCMFTAAFSVAFILKKVSLGIYKNHCFMFSFLEYLKYVALLSFLWSNLMKIWFYFSFISDLVFMPGCTVFYLLPSFTRICLGVESCESIFQGQWCSLSPQMFILIWEKSS